MNRLPLCQNSMLPFLPSVALSSTKFSQGGSFEGCRTQVRISRRVESDASGSTIAACQGPACPLCCEHVNDPSLWPGAGQVFSPTGFSWALAPVSLERFHVSVILPPTPLLAYGSFWARVRIQAASTTCGIAMATPNP